MIHLWKDLKHCHFYFLMVMTILVMTACASEESMEISLSPKPSKQTSAKNPDTKNEIDRKQTESQEEPNEDQKDSSRQESITVYVCGAVNQPGIYVLSSTSRMMEAIEAAGGMTNEADADILNLAQFMTDGQMIRIPFQGEVAQDSQSSPFMQSEEVQEGKIDLNKATSQELQTIPGIGQSKAEAIIKYREENGRFDRIEDLMQINGIKEASFRKMEPYICVK